MYNEIEKEFIPASNDWIFKTLYTLNPELLAAVIRTVTKLDISADKMTVRIVEEAPNEPQGKAIRLDIEVETTEEKIDIVIFFKELFSIGQKCLQKICIVAKTTKN